jgi:hypothetical protein
MAEGQDREHLVAGHVLRYGLTTPVALRSLVLRELTEKAISRLAERMVASSWLGRRRLPGGGRYFVLGERAAREHAVPAGRAYGYQALVGRIGVLHFCARLGFEVFTSREFRVRFPELTKAGFSASSYYVDRADVNRLGFIHVDHGRTSQRLITKMRSRIVGRYRDEDFAALIQADRFVIAIVTPTEEKAQAIQREIEARGPLPVRFRVAAVPELMPLLIEQPARRKKASDA